MTPQRARPSQLYDAALKRPPSERSRFLATACGSDDDLRREVQSLLEYHSEGEPFLETPALAEHGRELLETEGGYLAGRQFGPYHVISRLGHGGMGEVYRARDTTLGRDVAIKVLPLHLTAHPERRARLRREAQLLATLNHPHIGAIYGVEESGGILALALELVEGPTLADRLRRGPMQPTQALAIARQIAEALDAAHEKGIVHRDLKPANIVLHEGPDAYSVRAKVLDFGIAKSLLDAAPGDAAGSRPALVSETADGRILGTPAYMSPEQARGLPVDRRADIWAFGCVLFEMLSGQVPFEVATATGANTSVTQRDPDWTKLPPALPRCVRRLLQRCLQEDPARRVRDIRDAVLDLEESLTPDIEPSAGAGPASRRRALRVAAAAAALGTVLVAAWRLGAPSGDAPAPDRSMHLAVDLGPDVSLASGLAPAIGISPDGERLVYISDDRLMTRRLQDPAAVVLSGTEGVSSFFFSPDGHEVAFVADGKLQRVTLDGGAVSTIGVLPREARGGTWGEDNTIIVAGVSAGLARVPAGGGTFETVSAPAPGEFTQRWPQFLPGARAVLFTSHAYPDWFDRARVDVLSLADGRRKTLVSDATFGRFAAAPDGTGYLAFVRAGTLFAAPFDPVRLEVQGDAFPVVEGVAYNAVVGSAQIDVSRTGTLVYRGEVKAALRWLERAAAPQPLLPDSGYHLAPVLSNDGTRIAFSLGEDLWVYDLQRRIRTQVTKGIAAAGPLWTGDDRFLVFSTFDNLAYVRSDGGSQAQPLLSAMDGVVRYPTSIRSEHAGLRLAFMQLEVTAGRAWDLWTVPIVSDATALRALPPEPFLTTRYDERQLHLSPDGRWAAYNSNESGARQEVYVRAFPDDGRRWQISDGGGAVPQWAPERAELFFQAANRLLMVAPFSATRTGFVPAEPRLWSGQPLVSDMRRIYSVSRSGARVAALVTDAASEQRSRHVLMLWTDALSALRRRSSVAQHH